MYTESPSSSPTSITLYTIKSTKSPLIFGLFLVGTSTILYILHSICKHRRKRRLSIIQQDDDDVSVNSQEF